MLSRRVLLLALIFAASGCASQTGRIATDYSGSEVPTGTAVARSTVIFVGKILNSQLSAIPSNTFFTNVRSEVRVIQLIRGEAGGVVTVGYSLSGGDALQSPFRKGDLCVFCIFVQSLAEPGVFLVGKILPATSENIAEVRSDASIQ